MSKAIISASHSFICQVPQGLMNSKRTTALPFQLTNEMNEKSFDILNEIPWGKSYVSLMMDEKTNIRSNQTIEV